MQTECLPITRVPHTSKLLRDYISEFERVSSFYPHRPFDQSWYAAEKSLIEGDYPPARRSAVAAILKKQNAGWSRHERVAENLERLRSGALAIVSGQQVAMFGGPLFSMLKALTAIKISTEATAAGVECVPIFWMATEDHDVAEVSTFHYRVDGSVKAITVKPEVREGAPVSSAGLPKDVAVEINRLAQDLGDSQVMELIRKCYTPGQTLGESFARLFSKLFEKFGLIIIDPSDPELHRVASSFFGKAIKTSQDSAAQLVQRTKELENAGYAAQVKVTGSSTNLFLIEDGRRVPIHRNHNGFVAGERKYSEAELLGICESAPERLSAGALLRPVMQDFLLPTLAYVGGPAEIAYFAQSQVLYRQILGRVTPIVPRISATLVEKNVERKLEKFHLTVPELFASPQATQQLLAQHSLPAGLRKRIDNAKQQIAELTESLEKEIHQLDPTLVDASRRSSSKMQYQVERLSRRVANAQARKEHQVATDAALLSAALYPNGALQERTLSGAYFLAKYGEGLLDDMYAALQTSCPHHQILHL